MEKYSYNSNNGLWYELQGEDSLLCLTLDVADNQPIGMWRRKNLQYIKEHRPVLHTTLLPSSKGRARLVLISRLAQSIRSYHP